MASRSSAPEKRPGFFSQLRSLFTFTKDQYPWLPWVLIGILVLGAGLGVLIGFLIPPIAIWSVILWAVTGLMFGLLGAMITLTRLSTRAMYKKIDGMPGASGHVLSTSLGRKWVASDMPVGINPKTQDAVYRAIGRGGVVIVAEGSRGRMTRLVNDERLKVQRVAAGVPVEVIYVGHGDDEVPIGKLASTIKALPKKLDRGTLAAVVKRVDSVSQSVTSLPIPKGIDPMKARAPRPR
ncbi:DUF4191 domain-containing protein [Microbacterium invictum]|uniref:DUF4191 domain-containing protein n=1 Tax=Microbacterium invictum TaxID=515415 RepID=A0AA40VLR7_9MICO|nr:MULTISPECIES: DUF4191 domain-containing protein [Microbacterium]MBB4139112.1 hypothetical protein [Microbacterium invictum]